MSIEPYTFRLKPGQDLLNEINREIIKLNIESGCIICGVGSLTTATIKLANREYTSSFTGHFEIVSITGTVSTHGSHIHISIADENGDSRGGHLVEGCKIFTTAEIVLAIFPTIVYKREYCEFSGYEELVIVPK